MSTFKPAMWAAAAALAVGVLAWSTSQAQNPAPPAPRLAPRLAPQPSIATADVLGVVERMLASERYASVSGASSGNAVTSIALRTALSDMVAGNGSMERALGEQLVVFERGEARRHDERCVVAVHRDATR